MNPSEFKKGQVWRAKFAGFYSLGGYGTDIYVILRVIPGKNPPNTAVYEVLIGEKIYQWDYTLMGTDDVLI